MTSPFLSQLVLHGGTVRCICCPTSPRRFEQTATPMASRRNSLFMAIRPLHNYNCSGYYVPELDNRYCTGFTLDSFFQVYVWHIQRSRWAGPQGRSTLFLRHKKLARSLQSSMYSFAWYTPLLFVVKNFNFTSLKPPHKLLPEKEAKVKRARAKSLATRLIHPPSPAQRFAFQTTKD